MKLLTIIIPAYNVEKYLDDAMAPYLQIENPNNRDILIINDGSQDSTLYIAEKYEKIYSEFVKKVNKENGGHGSAINAGVRHARGKYFKVVDGDDWVDVEALRNILKILEICDSDMVVTGFEMVYEDINQKEAIHIRNIEYGRKYKFDEICSQIDYVRMHSTIFKTEIWIKNNIRLDEHCFYVDVEHDLLPLKWIKTVVFYDELLYQYRIGHSGQSVNIKSMIKNRENHMRVIKQVISLIKDESISSSLKDYIGKKLQNMLEIQYTILFSAEIGENEKKELKEFDDWLKRNYEKIYYSIKQKKILLLRKTRFKGYYIIKFIHHYFGKKEKYIK